MRDNPKIFTGCAVQEGNAKAKGKGKESPPPDEGGEKGDLLIWYLWKQEADGIHDMHVVNTDAVYYQSKTPDNYLETADCKKKKNYLQAYLNERRHFMPFANSLVGLLRVKTEATLKRIARRLAQKWEELYSRT